LTQVVRLGEVVRLAQVVRLDGNHRVLGFCGSTDRRKLPGARRQ
jgi:hypothetical protein